MEKLDKKYCPVCSNNISDFIAHGANLRPRKCPRCGSLSRHRLAWFYISQKSDLFYGKKKKLLHIAPEKCLISKFEKQLGENYISGDLSMSYAKVKIDITNIHMPGHFFDALYCSHVLEHVVDDRKAMKEFYRVLRPNGWALLLVPIDFNRKETYEDETIVTPIARRKAFGQEDHVRIYGTDYFDRLREVGFNVEFLEPNDLTQVNEVIKMGLDQGPMGRGLCLCTKNK